MLDCSAGSSFARQTMCPIKCTTHANKAWFAQWHLCEDWPEGFYGGCSLAGTMFGTSVGSGVLFGGKPFGSLLISSFTVALNQLIIH